MWYLHALPIAVFARKWHKNCRFTNTKQERQKRLCIFTEQHELVTNDMILTFHNFPLGAFVQCFVCVRRFIFPLFSTYFLTHHLQAACIWYCCQKCLHSLHCFWPVKPLISSLLTCPFDSLARQFVAAPATPLYTLRQTIHQRFFAISQVCLCVCVCVYKWHLLLADQRLSFCLSFL